MHMSCMHARRGPNVLILAVSDSCHFDSGLADDNCTCSMAQHLRGQCNHPTSLAAHRMVKPTIVSVIPDVPITEMRPAAERGEAPRSAV